MPLRVEGRGMAFALSPLTASLSPPPTLLRLPLPSSQGSLLGGGESVPASSPKKNSLVLDICCFLRILLKM